MMSYKNIFVLKSKERPLVKGVITSALIIMVALGSSGCSKKEQKSGQVLAKVNGEEITVHQLNQELTRAPGAKQKQILDALVNRQLLIDEAVHEKLDRDPNVMQTLERARSEILAQSYIQRKVANLPKPSKAEVDAFYQKHPELFGQRKLFDTRELVVATKDLNSALKSVLDSANSMDEVSAWLDKQKIRYAPRQISRTTTDLPLHMTAKWQALKKGDKLVMAEGEYSILAFLNDISSAPISAEAAGPQIEQYLRNTRAKEAEAAELTRLRSAAKIEYLNSSLAQSAPEPQKTTEPVDEKLKSNNIDQGIKGLR